MNKQLKIAVVQCLAQPLSNPDARFNNVLKLIKKSHAKAPDLLIFPEAILTGYNWNSKEEALQNALTEDHSWLDKIHEIVIKQDTEIILGTLLKDEEQNLFNAAIHFKLDNTRFIYHKSTPIFLGADRFCDIGDQLFGMTNIKGFKVAILICYDLSFPIASFLAGRSGADLLAVPTNWPIPSATTTAEFTVLSRAYESKCYLAAANKVGEENNTEFCGLSCIVSPKGQWLQRAGYEIESGKIVNPKPFQDSQQNEEILYATLEKNQSQKFQQFEDNYAISIGDVQMELVTDWLTKPAEKIPTSHEICQTKNSHSPKEINAN